MLCDVELTDKEEKEFCRCELPMPEFMKIQSHESEFKLGIKEGHVTELLG